MIGTRVRVGIGATVAVAIGIAVGMSGGGGSTDPVRASFASWFSASGVGTNPDVEGMPINFVYPDAPSEPVFIYPRLAAEKILWHLAVGQNAAASTLADKLITWQSTANSTTAEQRRRGGFPSIIAEDPGNPGEWIAAANAAGTGTPRYYSHDALAIVTALCAVYDATGDADHLAAAELAGDFLLGMVSLPEAAGYLDASNAVAPVNFVDQNGSWDVDQYPTVAYAWIGGLDRLAALTSETDYSDLADTARTRYALGQHAQGWWYSHLTTWSNYPTLPPAAYSSSNWKRYSEVNSTIIADDYLHATLGAWAAGDSSAFDAAVAWVETAVDQNGCVPGYLLTGSSGAHGFGLADVYCDIVSSALWRSVAQRAGDADAVAAAARYVEAAQDADGGWRWGRYLKLGLDATAAAAPEAEEQQAPHTGMHATADLATPMGGAGPSITYASTIVTTRLTSLAVTPAGVDIGSTPTQFTCTATWSDATTSNVTSTSHMHVDDPTKATVSTAGVVTPVGTGAANVYCAIGRIASGAAYIVTAAP